MSGRFLTREQVADELAISRAQVYALFRRKDLRAMKPDGRGIRRTHLETARCIDEHPFTQDEEGVALERS